MTEHKIPIPSMIYNAAVGGHVTNSQQIIDENLNREQNDINQETVGAVPYNSTTPNGMGRIVLKKNDNFKQVVESQTNGNTIFVIKYDFTLGTTINNNIEILSENHINVAFNGSLVYYAAVQLQAGQSITITNDSCFLLTDGPTDLYWYKTMIANTAKTVYVASVEAGTYNNAYSIQNVVNIPKDSILQFEGGTINNGTINGNNTRISASLSKIFDISNKFVGTWDVDKVFPEWFGSVGDGVTDDYDAINSALYSNISTCLYLSKLYAVSKGINYIYNTINNEYNRSITIEGSNNKESGIYLYVRSVLAPVIQVFGNGITIKNIRVKGSGTAADYGDYINRPNTHGVVLSNCKFPCIVQDCIITDISQNGIYAKGCWNKTHFINNVINEFYGEGILSSIQNYDTVISGNIIGKENSGISLWGIDSNTKRSIITNNIIINCYTGITYEDMNSNPSDDTEFNKSRHSIIDSNIIVNAVDTGINISSPTSVKNVFISNNLLYFTDTTGTDNYYKGIRLHNANNIIIKNNVIRSGVCSNLQSGRCVGIFLQDGNCNNITIQGNSIYNFQRFGIGLYDQNAVPENGYLDNIVIKENVIFGKDVNMASSIQLRDHMKNVCIVNNIFDVSISIVYLPTEKYISEGNKNITGGIIETHVLSSSKNNKDCYFAVPVYGVTANRPTNGIHYGFQYFDTTLSKPIYWSGTAWVDATGTPV